MLCGGAGREGASTGRGVGCWAGTLDGCKRTRCVCKRLASVCQLLVPACTRAAAAGCCSQKMGEYNMLGLEIRGPIIERANKWAASLGLNSAVLFLR